MAKNEENKILTTEELQAQLDVLQKENAALKEELEAKEKQNTTDAVVACVVKAKDGLNLRCGPSKTFAPLTVLPNGTTVEVKALPCNAEVPGWALVCVGDYIGWVMAEFLQTAE